MNLMIHVLAPVIWGGARDFADSRKRGAPPTDRNVDGVVNDGDV